MATSKARIRVMFRKKKKGNSSGGGGRGPPPPPSPLITSSPPPPSLPAHPELVAASQFPFSADTEAPSPSSATHDPPSRDLQACVAASSFPSSADTEALSPSSATRDPPSRDLQASVAASSFPSSADTKALSLSSATRDPPSHDLQECPFMSSGKTGPARAPPQDLPECSYRSSAKAPGPYSPTSAPPSAPASAVSFLQAAKKGPPQTSIPEFKPVKMGQTSLFSRPLSYQERLARRRIPVPLPIQGPFDLVLQWGRSARYGDRLFLHGTFQDFMPYNCSNDSSELIYEGFLPHRLHSMWPQLKPKKEGQTQCEADLKFWKYEWMQHGKVFGLPLQDYFNMVIELYELIPFEFLNLSAGLSIRAKDLQERFYNVLGVVPEIRAVPHPDGRKNTYVLTEIRIRVNSRLEFVDAMRPFSGGISWRDSDIEFVPFLNNRESDCGVRKA